MLNVTVRRGKGCSREGGVREGFLGRAVLKDDKEPALGRGRVKG